VEIEQKHCLHSELKKLQDQLGTQTQLIEKMMSDKQLLQQQAHHWHKHVQAKDNMIADLNGQCTDLTKQLLQLR
jgi:hypothetical protein